VSQPPDEVQEESMAVTISDGSIRDGVFKA
jgi:hypothetical protein